MAYVSQELKKELAPGIKAVLKKYRVQGTIAVRNHSTLVVNLKKGLVDFGGTNIDVNPYHIEDSEKWNDEARAFLLELKEAMMVGNFDKSDTMTDYFHVGWYININVGGWKKPYECTDKSATAKPRYRYTGGEWVKVAA